jgi:hypothetical protein
VRTLKGAKLEELILSGQVNAKNGTATDEIVKEEVTEFGQQMGVTGFEYKKNGM